MNISRSSLVWRKCRILFSVWFAHMTANRAEIVIWMLASIVPLIMMGVWIGKAQAAGGTLGSFNAPEFAAYFMGAWLTGQWTATWVVWDMDFQVRQGTLSSKLLRPIHPIWEYLASHVSDRCVRIPIMLVFLAVILWFAPKGTILSPDLAHVVLFLLSVTLAFLIKFTLSSALGTLCFWTESSTAFDILYFDLSIFLAGSFAPLEFFPPFVKNLVQYTPFPYVISYPVQILTGKLPDSRLLEVLGLQCLWVLAFGILAAWLWKIGIKKYGAVGA
jgi:ABC-2 type transport system permease protein